MDEWIPASERLPENGVEVLCCFEGRMYVGYYKDGDWQDERYWSDCTHWMPLPKKPE